MMGIKDVLKDGRKTYKSPSPMHVVKFSYWKFHIVKFPYLSQLLHYYLFYQVWLIH